MNASESTDALSGSLEEVGVVLKPLFRKTLQQTLENIEIIQKANLPTLLIYVIQDLVTMHLRSRGIDPITETVAEQIVRLKSNSDKSSKPEKEPVNRMSSIRICHGPPIHYIHHPPFIITGKLALDGPTVNQLIDAALMQAGLGVDSSGATASNVKDTDSGSKPSPTPPGNAAPKDDSLVIQDLGDVKRWNKRKIADVLTDLATLKEMDAKKQKPNKGNNNEKRKRNKKSLEWKISNKTRAIKGTEKLLTKVRHAGELEKKLQMEKGELGLVKQTLRDMGKNSEENKQGGLNKDKKQEQEQEQKSGEKQVERNQLVMGRLWGEPVQLMATGEWVT
ncbi:uncharacterized protein EI90DRAFT_3156640 [Cantharellus anzutake]|uniref:uncharacterized protein n=1 Tax=Cantharellus anzutake TaxID=1750568 RepID=UPI001903FFEF|nr:uncharacterized protein EI90DRAFT_3156640 [Cantharellus anzutake]KAF8326371.1 hypothetical protein EI90DRAFT_3156640 [Cantharellus anzutake]